MTIDELKQLKESEHKVEFKEAQNQNNYNAGRRSVIGYIVALANEGGGMLVLGVRENKNGIHSISGSSAWLGQEGKLAEDILDKTDNQSTLHRFWETTLYCYQSIK